MRYVVESMQQWGQIFTDPDYWRTMIEHILEKHDLGDIRQIRAGYPGSNAVFWVNDAFIVKIFGQAWKEDFDRELELYHHLAFYDSLLVPEVMADGVVYVGQEWKYMVMEGLPGERIGDVWTHIPRDNQLQIGEHLGQIVKQLHDVAVDGIRSMDTRKVGWSQFVQTQMACCVEHHRANNSLPEHLLAQILDYLENASPLFRDDFSPCIVNSDITKDHVLLSQVGSRWKITGLIDFGDVEIGYRDYEFVALYLDALDCDTEVMRIFLQAYDYPNGVDPRFNQRLMAYSILHRYLNFKDVVFLTERYGDLEGIKTLEELQRILWDI